MKFVDVKTSKCYAYESPARYARLQGYRVYPLASELYSMHWDSAEGRTNYQVHMRNQYKSHRMTTGLPVIVVPGYRKISAELDARLRALTIQDVIDNNGRLPEDIDEDLDVIQVGRIQRSFADFTQAKEISKLRWEQEKTQVEQEKSADFARMQAALPALDVLLGSQPIVRSDGSTGHSISLTTEQVEKLAAALAGLNG